MFALMHPSTESADEFDALRNDDDCRKHGKNSSPSGSGFGDPSKTIPTRIMYLCNEGREGGREDLVT